LSGIVVSRRSRRAGAVLIGSPLRRKAKSDSFQRAAFNPTTPPSATLCPPRFPGAPVRNSVAPWWRETQGVGVFQEDWFLTVPAAHQVIDGPWILEAKPARHAGRILCFARPVNLKCGIAGSDPNGDPNGYDAPPKQQFWD